MNEKTKLNDIIKKLGLGGLPSLKELKFILNINEESRQVLAEAARGLSLKAFGNKIYLRGLIEISSYCKNNCFYCGIRQGNAKAERYRLSKAEILSCCKTGAELGFKTFVLQGGEDPYYNDDVMCEIVAKIKSSFPQCAVTLSLGERSYESYKRLYDAGADRYLLRHETADEAHYGRLHPKQMSLQNRKKCLFNLKEIGYQTGCGIMVGSPYQTAETILQDLEFMKELEPHMIGIGPFVSHKDTPFKDFPNGSVDMTLILLSVLRLMFPKVLLPATTALGTLDPQGREKGILAGANVLMPNLSPVGVRKKYSLYDNKICTGEEAAECRMCLRNRISKIGYEVIDCRGDYGIKY
ncbi:MAG: [FeFe] hydrogenase H-cluster radical SAM maturase HydE [Clostridiales bacterium]|nr:[FeFe] hydrogenase H-cluster radical SAM maturase HydE [Clostridiales bacterium]